MRKGKIVIADDEAIIRMDLKEMLEAEGYQVIAEAADGEKAYQYIAELDPDLAILDINMPKCSGLDVARRLSGVKSLPIVILTAYSQEATVEEAVELGIYSYLIKPVQEEQLFPALRVAEKRFDEYQALLVEFQDLDEKVKGKTLIADAVKFLQTHYEMDEDSAYRRIRKYSMEKRLTLKEVAVSILKAAAELEKKA